MRGLTARIPLFAAAAGAAALMSIAPATARVDPAPKPQRECFHADSVSGFLANDEKRVYVRSGRKIFELEVLGNCPDLDWATRIGLRTVAGSSFVCTGMDVDLIVPRDGIGPDRCPVRTVRRLSEEEYKALPKGRGTLGRHKGE